MRDTLEQSLVRAAAQNNAEWCDAFCRTHGVDGRFEAGRWFSPVRTPPYYPDAVTLLPEVTVQQVLSGIDTSEGCSVKDSFAGLDLSATGFRALFRAEWLVLKPADARALPASGWSVVRDAGQLAEWEAAWAELPEGSGFFRYELLEDDAIGVLARYDGDRIVAGAIVNRSATVMGLSNVFDIAGDLESAWMGSASAAVALWGGLPAVSYDSGDSLAAARRAGFESVGELVVWQKALV